MLVILFAVTDLVLLLAVCEQNTQSVGLCVAGPKIHPFKTKHCFCFYMSNRAIDNVEIRALELMSNVANGSIFIACFIPLERQIYETTNNYGMIKAVCQ